MTPCWQKCKKISLKDCNSAHIFQDRVVWGRNKTYNVENTGDNKQAFLGHMNEQGVKVSSCKNIGVGLLPTNVKNVNLSTLSVVDKQKPENDEKVVEVEESPTGGKPVAHTVGRHIVDAPPAKVISGEGKGLNSDGGNDVKKVEVEESPTGDFFRRHFVDALPAKVISEENKGLNSESWLEKQTSSRVSGNEAHHRNRNFTPNVDSNYGGIEDKFVNSILHVHRFANNSIANVNTIIHQKWREQSQFDFGFVPIDEQKMPSNYLVGEGSDTSVFQLHAKVKASGVPNYMGVRIPVKSQLNVDVWKEELDQYWDQQLLQLLEFGFPLDFNRNFLSDVKVVITNLQLNS